MDIVSFSFISREGVIDIAEDTVSTATLKNLNTIKIMKHSVCITNAE